MHRALKYDLPPAPAVIAGGAPNAFNLFGNTALGFTAINDGATYTFGMQFSISSGVLTAIRFYSPPGATVLPTACCVYDLTIPAIIAGTQNNAPAWSGAAGSGWVQVSYPSVALPLNRALKVAVLKDASLFVYGGTSLYWSTGPGAGGLTSGPISAPNNAGAGATGQDSFVNPSNVLTLPNTSFNSTNYGLDVEITA